MSSKKNFGSLLETSPSVKKRNRAEKRFRLYGQVAIAISVAALVVLLLSIFSHGRSAFFQTFLTLEITFPETLDKSGERDLDTLKKVSTFGYKPLIVQALKSSLAEHNIEASLSDKELLEFVSKEALAELRRAVLSDPQRIGTTQSFSLLTNGRIDGYLKGRVTKESAALDKKVSPLQLELADQFIAAGQLKKRWNWRFLTAPDASGQRPETAGLGVALLGSLYLMVIVLVLSLPIGVFASIYLEEFAARNWLTDLIEVNIANLAAVPSIVFGILGLAIFINFLGLPQSAPIIGGLVLSLMTLPTIIIATRAALKAVPPSIREAALGVGASPMQTVFHHVLPLAAPGILTGTIIGLARALGETAPLLLIGMVAFVREFPAAPPQGFFEPASALPIQVYNWTQRADPAFVERSSGAIIVLLIFLLAMNTVAVILRRKFERRW